MLLGMQEEFSDGPRSKDPWSASGIPFVLMLLDMQEDFVYGPRSKDPVVTFWHYTRASRWACVCFNAGSLCDKPGAGATAQHPHPFWPNQTCKLEKL